jgi:hypothetical protein
MVVMTINEKSKVLVIIIILCVGVWANDGHCLAKGIKTNGNNESSIKEGDANPDEKPIDSGNSWAGYGKSCGKGPFTLKFNLESLIGGIHASINMNGSDRYAIGLINDNNSSLSTYIIKQKSEIISSTRKQSLVKSEKYNQTQIAYDRTQTYQVEIVSKDGRIQVFINNADQKMGVQIPVIDYYDPDPLPPGKIDFETFENSSAKLRKIFTNCSAPTSKKPPNLGVGYFEPLS